MANVHHDHRPCDEPQKIQVETCSDLYEKWKDEKSWFSNVPRKGITTEVSYIDTRPTAGNSLPVILCLHGAPGSHQNFSLLRSRLIGYSVRIICPNFPTYSLTKTEKFGHSDEEKASYVLDFLRALNLSRVDMLIGHSSSIYPSVIILDSEYRATLKALVLLNPCGHRRIQAMKYPVLDKTSAYFYQYKFFRFFIKHLGKPVLIMTKCPVKVENMDNLFLSVTTVNHSHYKRLSEKLERIGADKDLAKMMIFAENDKLIQKEIFYEMAKMLGIESDNIEVYDHNGLQQRSALDTGYPKGIALQDGGHYAFLSHHKIVNEAIAEMVENILLDGEKQNSPPATDLIKNETLNVLNESFTDILVLHHSNDNNNGPESIYDKDNEPNQNLNFESQSKNIPTLIG